MNDELTTRLREQLHDQVDDLHDAPLTLESVRGRAHAIRRTRRVAVAGAAAAAVVAIAVPTALLGDGTGRTDRPPEIAETPTGAADPVSGLRVPYVVDDTVTMPDGSERELPEDYREVVRRGEEILGVAGAPGTPGYRLERLADDGSVEETVALGGGSVARSADGSAIAYVTPEAHMVIEGADGQVDLGSLGEVRGLKAVRPLRVVGGPDCDETGDCAVYFEDRGSAWLVGDARGVPLGEGALKVHDVSTDELVALLTSVDEIDPGSCSEIQERQSGTTVFETCDHTPYRFSPDGSYLSALPPYLSGIGPSSMSILDGTSGEELATYETGNGFISTTASVWEDPDHLLVMAYEFETRSWSVTRLGADGSQERVLGPTKGPDTDPPWTLVAPG